jgi:hypothetical protein
VAREAFVTGLQITSAVAGVLAAGQEAVPEKSDTFGYRI